MPGIGPLTVDWQHFLELEYRNAQGAHNFVLVRLGSSEVGKLCQNNDESTREAYRNRRALSAVGSRMEKGEEGR